MFPVPAKETAADRVLVALTPLEAQAPLYMCVFNPGY